MRGVLKTVGIALTSVFMMFAVVGSAHANKIRIALAEILAYLERRVAYYAARRSA